MITAYFCFYNGLLYFQVLFIGIAFVFPILLPGLLVYLTWIWVVDKNIGKRGGRPVSFLRKLKYWKYLGDYFPAKLEFQERLDPSKTYIFAAHPHGLFSWGVWSHFMNEVTALQECLNGVDCRILTLDPNFKFLVWRDVWLGLGLASVSKESCDYLLSRGTSVLIAPGGTEEMFYSHPGTNKILQRKGFIRLALEHGANLVPIFTFGETDLFSQIANPPGSLMRRLQIWYKKYLPNSLIFFWGRYALLPRKQEIFTIIGKPIEVQKKANFQEKDVNELHKKYFDALSALYYEYADKYGKGIKLEFV